MHNDLLCSAVSLQHVFLVAYNLSLLSWIKVESLYPPLLLLLLPPEYATVTSCVPQPSPLHVSFQTRTLDLPRIIGSWDIPREENTEYKAMV